MSRKNVHKPTFINFNLHDAKEKTLNLNKGLKCNFYCVGHQ